MNDINDFAQKRFPRIPLKLFSLHDNDAYNNDSYNNNNNVYTNITD